MGFLNTKGPKASHYSAWLLAGGSISVAETMECESGNPPVWNENAVATGSRFYVGKSSTGVGFGLESKMMCF
jgi:hypothetical protein